MTPQELGRIREIYETALRMTTPDRVTFLERECHGNIAMRIEVEQLLTDREHVPGWLDQPLLGATRPLPAHVPMEGRQLSGYTLIREIGRGGMGSVYLAERSDGAFRKQVAVKLVQLGFGAAYILARFQQERDILASLDHPNIARLIDGGSTEEGWPYFVMEFVDGQRIDRWCDEQKLNITQRIELFRNVLSAVRYAHQRLVVHRDLKPGNILVTKDGAVKLLDFGIAKVVAANQPGVAQAAETLARQMTPEYASPEQINGAPITTLTDVYSLGVVLYELLTGHKPYVLLSAAMHELARVIAEIEPKRPSAVVSTTEVNAGDGAEITPDTVSGLREGDPIRLRKRLEGDLDCVLLTALQKEPERRYGSVQSFADDLQRHLEHRPVTARGSTVWYRVGRFCRRNPFVAAAAALFAVSFVIVVWQARMILDANRVNSGDFKLLTPIWIFFSALGLGGLGLACYFARPAKARLLGALAGGAVWTAGVVFKYWLGDSLGWWRSRIAGTPDPLMLFSPWIWLTAPLAGAAILIALSLFGRRYGWKLQALLFLIIGVMSEVRERLWFTILLPALTYDQGWRPVFFGAAITLTSGALGLLVMRIIAGPDTAQAGKVR